MNILNELASLLKSALKPASEPALKPASEPASEPELFQNRFLSDRHGERIELWVAEHDKKNFGLDIDEVDSFLSQRWAKIDNGSLTSRPMSLPINPKAELDSIKSNSSSDVYRLASTASEVHAFYLDFMRYPDLYKDASREKNFNSPAQVAASATCLHPQTALLILEDETQNITTGGEPRLSQDAIVTLIRLADKATNGHIAIHGALTSGVLHQPEAILKLFQTKSDIKLPDSTVSLISFPDGKTIRNIDFSKLENANLIVTKNIVFENCTFGQNMSKEQLATAKGFRDCTFAKELGLRLKNFVGEQIVFDTETQPTKFPTVGKPTPPTPLNPIPNLCISGTNGNEPQISTLSI